MPLSPRGFLAMLSCIAAKAGVRLPWRTRSAGRVFTGHASYPPRPFGLFRLQAVMLGLAIRDHTENP
ncbi:hypothetical protein [Methylocaldum sp.]|uniref:hypothetical protein n=1 Tax=Methylocaldum sp. TaxID=1969727 RepID=UPI002D35165D|nr:hypothetical protein [Methylocaldum sp.]HYE36387.1 hypothetical protein [Methylocaldum sp.]